MPSIINSQLYPPQTNPRPLTYDARSPYNSFPPAAAAASSSRALPDVRLDEEMNEQNQTRAEQPVSEQRSIFNTCIVGGLGQEGQEAGTVACSTCAQTGSWLVRQFQR